MLEVRILSAHSSAVCLPSPLYRWPVGDGRHGSTVHAGIAQGVQGGGSGEVGHRREV